MPTKITRDAAAETLLDTAIARARDAREPIIVALGDTGIVLTGEDTLTTMKNLAERAKEGKRIECEKNANDDKLHKLGHDKG